MCQAVAGGGEGVAGEGDAGGCSSVRQQVWRCAGVQEEGGTLWWRAS